MYENSLLKQEKIKLDTIVNYLIELKSRHIDYELSLQAFDNLRLDLMLKEEKRIFAQIKRVRLSIIKNLLEKIISVLNATQTRNDVNVNAAFKIVWVEFLRLREITYLETNRKKIVFDRVKTTREDVSFVEND
jgi:hypothetical protein